MNNHTPREPIPPLPNRQRPLQKSMFLPTDHLPSSQPMGNQQQHQYTSFNHLKRSVIEGSNNPHPTQQLQFRPSINSLNAYQPSPISHSPFATLESRTSSQHELIQHSNSTSNLKHSTSFHTVETPVIHDQKSFTKLQKGRNSYVQISDNKNLINDVVNEIKDKHLPALISVVKKQLHDEVQQLRSQFLTFRQEMKTNKTRQDLINSQLRNNGSSGRNSDSLSKARKSSFSQRQKEKEFGELQKDFFLLEGKIKTIESKITQGFEDLNFKIKNFSKQQKNHHLKSSSIRSSLTPIMLEYKQHFSVKQTHSLQSSRKSTHQQEITISSSHYYVDKHGYLLDDDSHYLVDSRGSQVRLDEKHLKLLQKHRILFK